METCPKTVWQRQWERKISPIMPHSTVWQYQPETKISCGAVAAPVGKKDSGLRGCARKGRFGLPIVNPRVRTVKFFIIRLTVKKLRYVEQYNYNRQ